MTNIFNAEPIQQTNRWIKRTEHQQEERTERASFPHTESHLGRASLRVRTGLISKNSWHRIVIAMQTDACAVPCLSWRQVQVDNTKHVLHQIPCKYSTGLRILGTQCPMKGGGCSKSNLRMIHCCLFYLKEQREKKDCLFACLSWRFCSHSTIGTLCNKVTFEASTSGFNAIDAGFLLGHFGNTAARFA